MIDSIIKVLDMLKEISINHNADMKKGTVNIENEISEMRHTLYHVQIDIKILSYIIMILILILTKIG